MLASASGSPCSYAVDQGNENPGGAPGVITDADIQSAVQVHWPDEEWTRHHPSPSRPTRLDNTAPEPRRRDVSPEEGDDGAVHEHWELSPRAQLAFRRIVGRPPNDTDLIRVEAAVLAVIQAIREEHHSDL